ncbi:Uu.00g097370.m01.CDS01 [Anthostomella pinea]|uniref:Uu.00g097370.m01.CDS01 n=1 Tax=Anthostomella pinea TaxID=933095 RepID=A0AAI8V7C1_9PEZI|nr:Uu.00g097370.m01.CDS01 [Anthostomella pinea]
MQLRKLLRSYGATVEPSVVADGSDLDAASAPDVEMDEDATSRSNSRNEAPELEEKGPQLITKEGMSIYFDSAPWFKLGDERHPELGGSNNPVKESHVHEGALFFEPERTETPENLANLHPLSQMLPKFKEIYADRVDPLVKILHLPTFWAELTHGLQHPQGPPKSLEAMMFAFYLATVSSVEENECRDFFGVAKSVLCSRYRGATRQALINAKFLSTSSPMTLRAYAVFMMCVRKTYHVDTLFVMSGVAIRLARKMGLHRDGTSFGLSPFDTEMRRRLWWHLAFVDYRTAEVLGTRPSLDLACADTKIPLNIDDDDLSPEMKNSPQERKGFTSIALCLIRYEAMEAMRQLSTNTRPVDTRREVLCTPITSLARKDSIIAQVEDQLERKYLRYCDPSKPLHTFASIMIRSSVCQMKLSAHNPRQFLRVPQSERNIVFENAMKLLEYLNFMRSGQQGLEKYMWQIGTSYLWNAMLYVLIESRHRKTGPEVDRSWRLIGVVFSDYAKLMQTTAGSVCRVLSRLGRWTLDVWDDHIAALKVEGFPEPSTPDYITAIRHYQTTSLDTSSERRSPVAASGSATQESSGHDCVQTWGNGDGLSDSTPLGAFDFSGIPSFEMAPTDWEQWERLIAEQSDFSFMDSV